MPPTTPQQPEPQPAQQPQNVAPTGFGAGVAAAEQQKVQNNLKTTEDKYRRTKTLLYIVIGLGSVALIAAITFGVLYANASVANSKKYDEGYGVGAEEQKKKDEDEAIKASLSDTRDYIAPEELGAFQMRIPKSFSISTSKNGKDQLILLAHPDKVDTNAKELAIRVTVRDELFTKAREKYDRDAKEKRNGIESSEEIKVSDRDAVRYVGKIDRAEKVGTLVLVKYLDKTILFKADSNENTTLYEAYKNTLNSIILP